MPCTVKKTFEIARDTGNHLLVQLKANQAKLFDAVSAIADSAGTAETAFMRNAGRSRQEDRTVEVFPVGDALNATEWQPFVKTIIRVTRHTLLRSAATGLWDQRGEVAYYLSSATALTATQWGNAIRGHWGIENRNHYVRDVSCEEDKCRIRDNPGIWQGHAASPLISCAKTTSPTSQAHSGTEHSTSITSWHTRKSDQR